MMAPTTPFQQEVLKAFEEALRSTESQDILSFLEQASLQEMLNSPPQFQQGQAALACHRFARFLKLAPAQIAEKLASSISLSNFPLIEKVEAQQGFLNFHCACQDLAQQSLGSILSKEAFSFSKPHQTLSIDVEYASSNTHKMLHVGHLRNLLLGDAVCNLIDKTGNKALRSTYPGDLGTHIAKVLWFIEGNKELKALAPEEKALWLGKAYGMAAQKFKSLEKEDPTAAQKAQKKCQEILAALQEKSGPYYELYLETREWSLSLMKDMYAWLGSHFDAWYFESEVDEVSRKLVLQKLEEGIFQKSEGAIGLDLSEDKLGFALLLKSDGNGLYLTKDIELIRRKFENPETKKALYVVDSRQKLHFKQLFKVAEHMGLKHAKNSEHLSYESVVGADGKAFSSRDSSGMGIFELKEKLEAKVKKDYLERHKDSWTPQEIEKCAEKIVISALKYGMLRIDPQSEIKFIEDQWLSLEGETGPYLLYVYARCNSLLKKAKAQALDTSIDASEIELETSLEKELFYNMTLLKAQIFQAAQSFRPSLVTQYVFTLSKLFNRFFKECPILNAPEKQRSSRLLLVQAMQSCLEECFEILGISPIERM